MFNFCCVVIFVAVQVSHIANELGAVPTKKEEGFTVGKCLNNLETEVGLSSLHCSTNSGTCRAFY